MSSMHVQTYKLIGLPKKSAEALAYFLSEEYHLKFDSTEAQHAIQDITAFVLGYATWKKLKSAIQSVKKSATQAPLSLCDEQCTSDTELTERRLFQEQRFLSGLHFLQQFVPEDVFLQLESQADWIIKQWQPVQRQDMHRLFYPLTAKNMLTINSICKGMCYLHTL